MADPKQNGTSHIADPRWQDLYRIGFMASIAFVGAIVFAMLAYFIWPYAAGNADVTSIYMLLQKDRMAGLFSLELSVPVLLPIMVLQSLALYVALKQTNESYALIALVFGLMGAVLWLTARPLVEMAYLSDQYAIATSDAAKNQYLAAGQALNSLFNGTAWMLSQFLFAISRTIEALLMLRSKIFTRITGYVGLVLGIAGLLFWVPAIGAIVSLIATFGGVAWYLLMARDLYKVGWPKQSLALQQDQTTRLAEEM